MKEFVGIGVTRGVPLVLLGDFRADSPWPRVADNHLLCAGSEALNIQVSLGGVSPTIAGEGAHGRC